MIESDTSLLLILIALLVAISVFAVILWKGGTKLRCLESQVQSDRQMLAKFELANLNIVMSIICLEESISMQWAAFDEVTEHRNEKMEKANMLFQANRMRIMKLIHHSGLTVSEDESALKASWALATEFGDQDTLELMHNLERFRRSENLPTFREHKEMLARRLNYIG
jgi:hypothetical protein